MDVDDEASCGVWSSIGGRLTVIEESPCKPVHDL